MYYLLITIGILFTALLQYRSQSQRIKIREKRLKEQNPEIQFEYNRFNTKKEREVTLRFDKDKINIKADIQNIQIANQTLVSKISSEYEGVKLEFDIAVFPFEKALFDIDEYRNFNQEGVLVVGSRGIETIKVLRKIEQLSFLEKYFMEMRATYIPLKSFKVDTAESKVLLLGVYADGKEFTLSIDHKNYLLEINTPLSSLEDPSNFKEYDPYTNEKIYL